MNSGKCTRTAAVIVCAALAVAPAALADTFDVKSVDVDKGQTEVETNNSLFRGFPVNADRLRTSHELALNYGFATWFKAGAKLNFDKPMDEEFRLATAGIEGQAVLKKFEGGVGIAWFTGLDFRIHRDETNSITFGPIVQLGTEKTHLLLNPFLSKTFGKNREEGIDFSFAWAVKHELREGFAVGIEGYSTIPSIADAPGRDFQEHRIGPVVYLERALSAGGHGGRSLSVKDTRSDSDGKQAEGPKLAMEFGVLFGLSEATQDTTFKIKGGISF